MCEHRGITVSGQEHPRVELAVVMPAYNEEACIADVLTEWLRILPAATAEFRVIVVNDGSRDGTRERLAAFGHDPRVIVINKGNEGHGPSILRGYAEGIRMAEWVFQVDSDNEMLASCFPGFWKIRDSYDFLFGVRTGRQQTVVRALVSKVSRLVVGAWSGGDVRDVNVPYRLMRADLLGRLLEMIPPGTFAPNVAIAGLAARCRYRIACLPVPHRNRKMGQGSLSRWRLFRSAVLSLVQTVRILAKCRGR